MSGGAGDYLEGYVKVGRALEKAAHVGKVLGHLVDGGDRTNASGSSIKPEYSQVLESLQELRRECRFACGGALTVSRKELGNCVLKVGPAEEAFQSNLESLNAEDLLEACSQHGEQGEDGVLMLASKGNLALQRAAQPGEKRLRDEGQVQNHSPSSIPFLSCIYAHIERNLNAGNKRFSMNLYALRIMESGQASTAEIGSSDRLGTVEVCFPIPFRGGELEITAPDQEEDADIDSEVFDFANMSNDSNVLRWAAYDADTVPVVSPVSDGYRISIIFDIVGVEAATDGTNNKVFKPPQFMWEYPQGVTRDTAIISKPNFSRAEPLLAFFTSSLREVFEKDEHVFFGMLLQEDYAGAEVDEEALAGIDRLLYDHLEQIGYHDLTLVSVLISEEGKVVAFANDDIQYICGDIDQSRSFETFGLIEDDSTPFIGALGSRIPVSGNQIIAQALVINLATFDDEHHAGDEDENDDDEEEEEEDAQGNEEDYEDEDDDDDGGVEVEEEGEEEFDDDAGDDQDEEDEEAVVIGDDEEDEEEEGDE